MRAVPETAAADSKGKIAATAGRDDRRVPKWVDMSPEDRLRVGMSIEDACLALPGWRFQQVYAPADTRRYHTWDFTAPGADRVTLRLTFDHRKLLLWGPPAPNDQAGVPPAKGLDAASGLSA